MPKISKYPDGGDIQSTDQIVIARSGQNYSVLGSSLMSLGSKRNVLPNGGFLIATRGNGPFTSVSTFVNNDDSYLLDGCIFLANGADTCDVSRVVDTSFVSGYKMRMDVETASRRFGAFFPVENADISDIRMSGKASCQFKVEVTGTSISNIRAYLLAWNSTADVITSDVIATWGTPGNDPTFAANWTAENTPSNIPVTTSLQTVKIENISVNTSGVTNIGLLIIVDDADATVGDYLEIGDVSIVEGTTAGDYKEKSIAEVTQACSLVLAYYSFGNPNPIGSGWASGIGTSAQISIFTPSPMRRSPTMQNGTVGNFTVRANGADNVATAMSLAAYKFNIAAISFTATVAASHVATVYANNTTYILLTCEL